MSGLISLKIFSKAYQGSRQNVTKALTITCPLKWWTLHTKHTTYILELQNRGLTMGVQIVFCQLSNLEAIHIRMPSTVASNRLYAEWNTSQRGLQLHSELCDSLDADCWSC